MILRGGLLALSALCFSACAPLVAEAPLFSAEDQIDPSPLVEGVWIQISEECPARHLRTRGRVPAGCAPIELRLLDDGAWQARARFDLARGEAPSETPWYREEPVAFVLAHVTSMDEPSLYVAEQRPGPEGGRVSYIALIPTLHLEPERVAFVLLPLDCHTILHDGPIDGIVPEYREETAEAPAEAEGDAPQPVLSACVAQHQEAVRAAARQQALRQLPILVLGAPRYVFARSLD